MYQYFFPISVFKLCKYTENSNMSIYYTRTTEYNVSLDSIALESLIFFTNRVTKKRKKASEL